MKIETASAAVPSVTTASEGIEVDLAESTSLNTKKYKLSFQYACRTGIDLASCKGEVYWNGKRIIEIIPKNHNVHTQKANVEVIAGENKLDLAGAGKSDKLGLTIDNVKLVEVGTTNNIVVNGGFEKPDIGKKWKIQDNIPGWVGSKTEVGWGKIYNKGWKSQVV